MNASNILKEIEPLGSEGYKKILFNHGIGEPCFGVKISELQKIRQRVKKDYRLALDLFDTGIYDAMYLAGLIADDERMTKTDLRKWVKQAPCAPLCSSTVAWVTAGSKYGWELGLEWIEKKSPFAAIAGWATLANLVSIKPDTELNIPKLKELLQRVQKTIHPAPDRVRYQMNSFVIAVGIYVRQLTDFALAVAGKIGAVSAELGNNSCQIPFAPDRIRQAQKKGIIGKKRRSAKC